MVFQIKLTNTHMCIYEVDFLSFSQLYLLDKIWDWYKNSVSLLLIIPLLRLAVLRRAIPRLSPSTVLPSCPATLWPWSSESLTMSRAKLVTGFQGWLEHFVALYVFVRLNLTTLFELYFCFDSEKAYRCCFFIWFSSYVCNSSIKKTLWYYYLY